MPIGLPVRMLMGLVLLTVGLSGPAMANICDAAALHAADDAGVPPDVMLAITRLETAQPGKSGDPWPWTVNHAGDGTWFQDEDSARSYVFSKVKNGARNIDIGCFQINYRWHAEAFRNLDDMFDPYSNAAYAAAFLTRLHREFGNWTEAAGAYHSRTPKFAERYKKKFRSIRASVDGYDLTQRAEQRVARVQTPRPLPRTAGSLFLSAAPQSRPFIQMTGSN